MSILRKIEREKIKKEQRNNKIQQTWNQIQIDKYSIGGYRDLKNKNKKRKGGK